MPIQERFLQRFGPALLALVLVIAGAAYLGTRSGKNGFLTNQGVSSGGTFKKPAIPPNDYVGGSECRRCHQTIWDRYQTHPMSISSALVGEASSLDEYDGHTSFRAQLATGEMEYRVEKTPEGVFHHELFNDFELGPIFDQKVQVELAVGSGRRGRSYVLIKDDHLYMSPISWYGQESKWDLSPNYPAGNHPRFERRIRQACIICHTDRISTSRQEPDQFGTPAVPQPKISCERCHGPGAGHIAFHEKQSKSPDHSSTAADPIVNPSKLDSERRESVCWQCHFSAEERITRYGRMDSDFRPGMHFDDVWVAFVRGTRVDTAGSMLAVSQVEQTRSSLCFQKSEGRFGCISCHDPHYSPPEHEKARFYREKCLACHAERGCALSLDQRTRESEQDSCVDCHMPSSGLKGIPHTAQVDHRVLRRRPSDSKSTLELPLSIFKSGIRELPQIEQDRAWGLAFAKIAQIKTDPESAHKGREKLAMVRSSIPDDVQVLEWLGVCELILGKKDNARRDWSDILKIHPNDEGALKRLADLAITERDLPAARDALVRSLKVSPWEGKHHAQLASIYGSLGDFDAATRHANEALQVNPTLSGAHGILAEIYKLQGNQSDARRHQKLHQRLELLK